MYGTKQPVVATNLATNKAYYFPTILHCAKGIDGQPSHVYECLVGKRKTHKGYIITYPPAEKER